MKYLLDTNMCIYTIKNHPPSVIKKFESKKIGDIGISTVTLAELNYGVSKSQFVDRNRSALRHFLMPLEIIPFDDTAAEYYGSIRTELEKKGKPIGAMDLMIGAHALSLNTILVTNNLREFSRINGLKIENWAA